MKRRSILPKKRCTESLTFRLTEKVYADFLQIVEATGAELPEVGRRTAVFVNMVKMYMQTLSAQNSSERAEALENEFVRRTLEQQDVIESLKSDLGLERVYRQQAEQMCDELHVLIEDCGTEMLRRRWELLQK